MKTVVPGYTTRGIVQDIKLTSGVLERVQVRVPEFHGPVPGTFSELDDSIKFTPNDQLPFAKVQLPAGSKLKSDNSSPENDINTLYQSGDIVYVMSPGGGTDNLLVTGIVCSREDWMSQYNVDEGGKTTLFGTFGNFFKRVFGLEDQVDTSGATNDINVSGDFKGIFAFPVKPGEGYQRISAEQGAGVRDSAHKNGHGGTDIACTKGTPVYACADGVIVTKPKSFFTYQNGYGTSHAKEGGGYGNHLIISHGVINGKQYWTVYAHMLSYGQFKGREVQVNDYVPRGTLIGQVGSTGNSTGPHLHLEIREGSNNSAGRRNPRNYIPFP